MARTYTDTQKADAVNLYVQHGLAEAHHRTGIPKNTLQGWLTPEERKQVSGRASQKTAVATEVRLADMAARRATLASDLMDDVQRIRAQLFAPCVERKAMVVSLGKEQGSEVEVVDIAHTQPPFADQQRIITTLAIAVDKIQILTGEATERVEHRQVPERTVEAQEEMDRTLRLVQDMAA